MPKSVVSRTVADAPSATSEKLNDVRDELGIGSINEGPSAHLGAFGRLVGRDIQPSIGIPAAFINKSIVQDS